MSKFKKAKERILSIPNDYEFDEAVAFLGFLGFKVCDKGKTSGSRVMFYRESDKRCILLHRPHPQKEMKQYAVKELVNRLKELGEL